MDTYPRSSELLPIFRDLAVVLKSMSGGRHSHLSSPPAKFVAHECQRGISFARAFHDLCNTENLAFRRQLFGASRIVCDSTDSLLTATDGDRQLTVLFGEYTSSTFNLPMHDGIVLFTDFDRFSLHRVGTSGKLLEHFALFTVNEFCDEIDFNGSFWDALYPLHFSIVSRTLSCNIPEELNIPFFRGNSSSTPHGEEHGALKQLYSFQSLFSNLLSLDQLCIDMQSADRPPSLLSKRAEADCIIRRYSPQRSELFNYGMPSDEFRRGDPVITYSVEGQEFHRDFCLVPPAWQHEDAELRQATFDLLHMLAIRRCKLFRLGFGRRVYNVLFPPVLLTSATSPLTAYALFPCLNLYRTALHGFRRTLSLTFLFCPVTRDDSVDGQPTLTSRAAHLAELYRLKQELLSHATLDRPADATPTYLLRGPGHFYFDLNAAPIPSLLRTLALNVFRRLLDSAPRSLNARRALLDQSIFTSMQESKIVTMSLLVDWRPAPGHTQPWERWLATGADRPLQNGLFRTLFYTDYLDPQSAEASPNVVRFQELNIGNTMGADMGGMTLYNPQESLKVVLYPKGREQYPNYSMLRWMTWQIYIDSALASMRALIYRFQPILEARGSLHSLIHTLDDMIAEFMDFYNLAISDYFYRREYERLRTLTQIDSDYEYLMTRFSSAKDDESLREQRLVNKLVLGLMIATVSVTIVSAVAQMIDLSITKYIIGSIVTSAIFVWIGYLIFDPVRTVYRYLASVINNRFWR